jgi:hypothetical protein
MVTAAAFGRQLILKRCSLDIYILICGRYSLRLTTSNACDRTAVDAQIDPGNK